MAYVRTDWVSGETPLSAENMNNIEDGVEEAIDGISTASGKVTTPARITQTFKGSRSEQWENTGISITVPEGHRYLVTVEQTWTSGKPLGLGLDTNNSATNPSKAHLGELVNDFTTILTNSTWYIYTYRSTTPSVNNTYRVSIVDFRVDSV